MARKKTPTEERYPNLRQETEARIAELDRIIQERREREERHRARLQRLSFGLLGRERLPSQ
jgi:hypothetical protein